MLQRKNKLNQLYQSSQLAGNRPSNRQRLRWVVRGAAERFMALNPQWGEYFFDLDFLLNRGLPIVEEHIAGVTSSGAIDLALAWAEEWPLMTAGQRKVCLQAQTVIAADLLRLVTEAILLPRPQLQGLFPQYSESWHGVGIPLAYVKAQNPPGRSTLPL